MRHLIDSTQPKTASNFLIECERSSSIATITGFFCAYGECKIRLAEGRIDEAGFWKGVGNAAGAGFKGVRGANDAIMRLGALVQTTGPVEAFDAKADHLLSIIKNVAPPKIVAFASKYADWAKANPVKQGLIVGLLTAVASLVTGPAGGAAAGYVLRFASELLKGSKTSGAIAKGVVGAGLGWLAGVSIRELAPLFQVDFHSMPGHASLRKMSNYAIINGHRISFDMTVPETLYRKADKMFVLAAEAMGQQDNAKADKIMSNLVSILTQPEVVNFVKNAMSNNEELAKQALAQNQAAIRIFNGIASVIQGVVNAGGYSTTDSKEPEQPISDNPYQSYNHFNHTYSQK